MESVENPLKPLKYEENRLPRKLWIKKALSTAFLWIAIYPQPVPCVFHRKPVDNSLYFVDNPVKNCGISRGKLFKTKSFLFTSNRKVY